MTKKIIAAIMSVILCFSLMIPVYAEGELSSGGLNLDIDINDILASDVMQEIMQNEHVVDIIRQYYS